MIEFYKIRTDINIAVTHEQSCDVKLTNRGLH